MVRSDTSCLLLTLGVSMTMTDLWSEEISLSVLLSLSSTGLSRNACSAATRPLWKSGLLALLQLSTFDVLFVCCGVTIRAVIFWRLFLLADALARLLIIVVMAFSETTLSLVSLHAAFKKSL